MSDFDDPYELKEHKEIQAIFSAIEDRPKFKVDMSLMDEMVQAVSIAKHLRQSAENIRLPSRYKTSDDLHKLVQFIREVQANRDRVIEVKLDHMPLRKTLDSFWERCLGILYKYESISKMSPAPKRDAVINFILQPLKDRIRDVDLIIGAATEADTHLNNAHFSIKALKDIGEIYIEGEKGQKGV